MFPAVRPARVGDINQARSDSLMSRLSDGHVVVLVIVLIVVFAGLAGLLLAARKR
jgi:hypothetical protein